ERNRDNTKEVISRDNKQLGMDRELTTKKSLGIEKRNDLSKEILTGNTRNTSEKINKNNRIGNETKKLFNTLNNKTYERKSSDKNYNKQPNVIKNNNQTPKKDYTPRTNTSRDNKTTNPPKQYTPPKQNTNPPRSYTPPSGNNTPRSYSPPSGNNTPRSYSPPSGNSGSNNSGSRGRR
ncbi:MAG: hypothetical protein KJZ60_09335, partial [Ignavibacteriaceae bacterium]|nr:hypothetical protein [Ignavibacteriaceae bacterium]